MGDPNKGKCEEELGCPNPQEIRGPLSTGGGTRLVSRVQLMLQKRKLLHRQSVARENNQAFWKKENRVTPPTVSPLGTGLCRKSRLTFQGFGLCAGKNVFVMRCLSADLAHGLCLLCQPSWPGGPCPQGREEIRGGWQNRCNCSCCLEATCEGSHLSLLDFLPGAAAGDDTEDASTEFTDSIEEEAAHNSHQQVSPSQVLGAQGGRLAGL